MCRLRMSIIGVGSDIALLTGAIITWVGILALIVTILETVLEPVSDDNTASPQPVVSVEQDKIIGLTVILYIGISLYLYGIAF